MKKPTQKFEVTVAVAGGKITHITKAVDGRDAAARVMKANPNYTLVATKRLDG